MLHIILDLLEMTQQEVYKFQEFYHLSQKKQCQNYTFYPCFCHLKYKTHSKGFYEMIEKYEENRFN